MQIDNLKDVLGMDLQVPGFTAPTTREMTTAQRKKRNKKRRISRRMRAYNRKHSKK